MNNKVVKNATWIIGIRIIQSILTLFISMLTARYLGPSNYGLISYASSIVAFATPIMQLGLTNILVSELVKNPKLEGELIGTSIFLCGISSIFCIIGVTSFSAIANVGEQETIIVCCLYSISLFFQSTELVQYWFQSKLLSKYVSISTLCAYVAISAYKIYLLATGKSVYWFAISYSLDYFLISILLFAQYFRLGGAKLRVSRKLGSTLLNKGKYFILSSMMVAIFAQTDKIMLKAIMDSASVGYYTAATTIAGMTSFVFTAIIDSFRPAIFERYESNKDGFRQGMSQLYSVVFYLSLCQSIIFTVAASLIVRILYGSSYEAAVSALQIVVWYTTFSYFGSVRNIWIVAEQKQRYLWILNLSGAIGNVILNLIFIPIWGINGAALASLITQIFTNVIMNQVIKPIRPVNQLMLAGCNPQILISMLRRILDRKDIQK